MYLQGVRPTPASLIKGYGSARSVMPSGLVTVFTVFFTVFSPWRRFV